MKDLLRYLYFKKKFTFRPKADGYTAASIPVFMHLLTLFIVFAKLSSGWDDFMVDDTDRPQRSFWDQYKAFVIVCPLVIIILLYYFSALTNIEQKVEKFNQLTWQEKRMLDIKTVVYSVLSYVLFILSIFLPYGR